jgi:hypothetical protein
LFYKNFILTIKTNKKMNNSLENKLSMYEKVQTFLAARTAETSSIAAVATCKAELDATVARILTSAGISNVDITGYTVLKANKRAELTKATLKISTAMYAWARMNNKPQEAEKYDETIAMLNAMRDNDIYAYAQTTNVAAIANVANLATFGVVVADTATLTTRAAEFLVIIQQPKNQIGDRGAELENLTRLFGAADELLTLKLDAVMTIFSVSNLTMYSAYINARGIDDTGAVTSPDYEGELPISLVSKIASIPYLASRVFIINNTGNVPFVFGLSTSGTNITSDEVLIAAGATLQRTSASIASDGDYILLRNDDAAKVGSYQIRINE